MPLAVGDLKTLKSYLDGVMNLEGKRSDQRAFTEFHSQSSPTERLEGFDTPPT